MSTNNAGFMSCLQKTKKFKTSLNTNTNSDYYSTDLGEG